MNDPSTQVEGRSASSLGRIHMAGRSISGAGRPRTSTPLDGGAAESAGRVVAVRPAAAL